MASAPMAWPACTSVMIRCVAAVGSREVYFTVIFGFAFSNGAISFAKSPGSVFDQ